MIPTTITVGTRKAKAKFTWLLGHVTNGGEVIITQHGRPVARLSPIAPPLSLTRTQALRRIDELANCTKSGTESAKDLINAGRRQCPPRPRKLSRPRLRAA